MRADRWDRRHERFILARRPYASFPRNTEPAGALMFSFGAEGWGDELAWGAALTIGLALATLPVGLAIGLAMALAKNSRNRLLSAIGESYTTIFRGIPELLMLLLIYYGGQMAINSAAAAGWPVLFTIPPFAAGVLALGLVFGAYASEVFLSALRGIERGQIEAAASSSVRNSAEP